MTATQLTIIIALITQVGLVVASMINKRSSATDKQKTGVEILQAVTADLRIELDRKAEDNAKSLVRAAHTIKAQDDEIEMLRDDLMNARKDTRGAYETAGISMRRVVYLEEILRKNEIVFDPGPLA